MPRPTKVPIMEPIAAMITEDRLIGFTISSRNHRCRRHAADIGDACNLRCTQIHLHKLCHQEHDDYMYQKHSHAGQEEYASLAKLLKSTLEDDNTERAR